MKPYIEYDQEVEAAYIYLAEGEHSKTLELWSGRVYVDLDTEGNALGVEVLGLPYSSEEEMGV